MNEKLMLIDGNSIFNRAFYGLLGPKMLSTSDGLYTNAIFGFINIIIKFLNDEKPSHLAIAFDMKAPTFRHEQYDKYKAHRKGMPEEMAVQMPVLKELLSAMNVTITEMAGFEADDILGTLATSAEKSGADVVIVTGDRDSLQLASEKVKIKIPVTKAGKTEIEEYDNNKVLEKYGVEPIQMIEVKALMGDSSDNIPGVPGIGEKTALELIRKFGSIDSIYKEIETIDIKDRIKKLLIENRDLAYLSKRLGTIELNVPISFSLCGCEIKEYDKQHVYNILKRLEFNSIISKLGLSDQEDPEKKDNMCVQVNVVSNYEQLEEAVAQIIKNGEFAYYPYLANKGTELSGIGLCWQQGQSIFIEINEDTQKQLIIESLKKIFESSQIKKYSFNSKMEYKVFETIGMNIDVVDFDIMIAAYLLNPAKETYILKELCEEYLNLSICTEINYFDKKELNKDNADLSNVYSLVGEYAGAVYELTKVLKQKLHENSMEKLYYDIELPLTRVLADMETAGVMIDVEMLESLSSQFAERIQSLTDEIIEIAGENFNINSTKQLGTILFEKLQLPVGKKTKTGYSTNVEVLESLASKHPIIDKILEYRQLVKLKSTYIDGMRNVINPLTHRIHSNFNQTVTVTGRISSTEPNLQNIPTKIEMGRQIRKLFIAQKGSKLVDADYSQIELRVLAHISNDENMINGFMEGQDVHRSTASKIFGVPENEVTPFMRGSAKAINFGLIYGKGEFSLAKDLRISRKQAKEYIENYFTKFSRVHEYMQEIIARAKEQGFVSTLLGRRRYLPELNSSNFNVRAASERMALNTPIQGTAADIIKIAMVKVHSELKNRGLKSRLILQVHDELIVEAADDEVSQVEEILKDCMENAYNMKVPLDVDMHVGSNWFEAK